MEHLIDKKGDRIYDIIDEKKIGYIDGYRPAGLPGGMREDNV